MTHLGFTRRRRTPPPAVSTHELGGGSRSPVLIGTGAVSHVLALVTSQEALVFTPCRLRGRTTPPRTVPTSTMMELGDHKARLKRLRPVGLEPPQLEATGARVTGADTPPRTGLRTNVGKKQFLPHNRPPLNGQCTKGSSNSHPCWPHLCLIGEKCARSAWLSITQP